jgi:ABC-type dipeptide/oligopeptide/nickel transport system permease subunit
LDQDKTLSPGRLAWAKLKQHKSAMFGLTVIALSIFVAVFCYVLVPDNSPDSNSMNLQVSLQPPGTSISFLKIPKQHDHEKTLLSKWMGGNPSAYKLIPLYDWIVQRDSLFYREYAGDYASAGEPGVVSLASLNAGKNKVAVPDQTISADQFISKKTFYLGTDRFGRDLLSRLMVATRVSLSVGLIAVVISLFIGIGLGSLAGYYRGWVDKIILWFINVIWSIPTLLLVVAITMALGKGFIQVFIAVGLTMWVEVARLVRGQFFSLREQQYVEAGRALGFNDSRIILRHILPNIIGPVIVIAASNFASAILLEAGLSFLGMGAQPPTPSWGMMIKENYSYIVVDAAWLAIFPGVAIALMVLSFTLLGNGLRDAFDTRST